MFVCRGLLDADQLDALGTLRRTDSAPNLGEQERLPFRQRRAVKKAAKAEKKGKKAERKAERKASKGRGRQHRHVPALCFVRAVHGRCRSC